MRTLVTGGAGFIGAHLVDELLAHGHQVSVIDSLATSDGSRLCAHEADPRLIFFKQDIRDAARVDSCFEGIDWVFHLAGLADIVPSVEDPRPYFETNVVGTLNVLEASRRHSVRRFVYAASSSVYGDQPPIPTNEAAANDPRYPYALTKKMGEDLVLHWFQVYGLHACSLRLFNVYGPKVRKTGGYGAVLGVFLGQRAAAAPLTIVGDGTQRRDFIFVKDVARAFRLAAEKADPGEIINIGSGKPSSVRDLAEAIGGPTVEIPKRPGEPECTWADIRRAGERLGWFPQVSLSEGIEEVLAELPEWKSAQAWSPQQIEQATRAWFAQLGERRG